MARGVTIQQVNEKYTKYSHNSKPYSKQSSYNVDLLYITHNSVGRAGKKNSLKKIEKKTFLKRKFSENIYKYNYRFHSRSFFFCIF